MNVVECTVHVRSMRIMNIAMPTSITIYSKTCIPVANSDAENK